MTAFITALVVAAIAALVSLYTTGALPPLERRVRTHTALVKDLPEDIGNPIRALLQIEVRRLVHREMRRARPSTRAKRRFLIGLWTGATIFLAAWTVVTVVLLDPFEPQTEGAPARWLLVATFLLVELAFTLMVATGISIAWRNRPERRRSVQDGPEFDDHAASSDRR